MRPATCFQGCFSTLSLSPAAPFLREEGEIPAPPLSGPRKGKGRRRAAVAVEFALVAPILLTLIFGLVEVSRMYEVENELETAAREGARLAAMDREGVVPAGESTNDKMIRDIRHFLETAGLPADQVTVTITDADHPGLPMNLDDPANDLKLFRLRVSLPSSAVASYCLLGSDERSLGADLVFRNARSTLIQ